VGIFRRGNASGIAIEVEILNQWFFTRVMNGLGGMVQLPRTAASWRH